MRARLSLSGVMAVLVGGALVVASVMPMRGAWPPLFFPLADEMAAPAVRPEAVAAWQAGRDLYPSALASQATAQLTLAAARQTNTHWPEAETALRTSLARYPQDPLGWGRLAYVAEREGNAKLALDALCLSVKTGPYLKGFMAWRLTLILKLWPDARATLPPAQLAVLASQAVLMWKTERWPMIKLSRLGPFRAASLEMMAYAPDEMREAFIKKQRWMKR